VWAFPAARTASNPAFQIKIAAMGLALANAWLFHAARARRMRGWDLVAPPTAVQASASLSLALWTAILLAGKLTPFVSPG
jgi:hypothetical protein